MFHTVFFTIKTLFLTGAYSQEINVTQYEEGGGFFLVALIIWLISLFIARRYMLKHVLKQMNKSSDVADETEPEILKEKEVDAIKSPTFIELDVDSNRESAIALRESFVKGAYLLFRKKYFFGVIASILYIVLPLVFASYGEEVDASMTNDKVSVIGGLAIFYLIYITLVFLFYRKQYRAINTKFGIRWEHPFVTLLRKLVNPAFQSYFTIGLIIMMASFGLLDVPLTDQEGGMQPETQSIWSTIGYVIAALIHVILIVKIRMDNKNVKNQSLLILRVFGDKNQAILTFRRLTEFWKHIGTWFTVADPSFVASRHKTFSLKTLFTMLVVFIFAFFIGMKLSPVLAPIIQSIAPENHASELEIEEFAMIPGMLIAWFLYFKFWKFRVSRSYAKNKSDIQRKIAKVINKPRNVDMTFKNLPMYCYDNTWKIAVNEFINNSHGILMDLRGFSSERKGCEYEIDFLLDKISINKVLFLVDVVSDKEYVKKTINERFELLRVNSPNLKNDNPIAKIFISDAQNEIEVQAIIDHLVETVHN